MTSNPLDRVESTLSKLSEEGAISYKANLNVFSGKKTRDEIVEYYNKCTENDDYDKHTIPDYYTGPQQTARYLSQYFEEKERSTARIIDVAAGTGHVGVELYRLGFRQIDALDPSKGMLAKAKQKGVYTNCIQEFIGVGKHVSVDDGTYDGLTCSGGFGENHIPANALHDMIRIVKPGGMICIVMREEYIHIAEQHKDVLIPLMTQLEDEKRWKLKSKDIIEFFFHLTYLV